MSGERGRIEGGRRVKANRRLLDTGILLLLLVDVVVRVLEYLLNKLASPL